MTDESDRQGTDAVRDSGPSRGAVWALSILTLLVVVGGGLLAWDAFGDVRAGERLGVRGMGFVVMYPVIAIAMVVGLVQGLRQRRRTNRPEPP